MDPDFAIEIVVGGAPSHDVFTGRSTRAIARADIPSRQLVDLMVSFSKALDVRCVYCDVIDEVAGAPVRGTRGAWGVLTLDLVGRRDSFTSAILAALAPFYNPALYQI